MVRKIVVSETDLDKIEQEPGDSIPEDEYEEWDELEDELTGKKKVRLVSKYSEKRYIP